MNFMLQTLLGQLQSRNPQAYQFINGAIGNGGNPNAVLSQMLSNASPEQRSGLIQVAKKYGCPDNYLKQIQKFR